MEKKLNHKNLKFSTWLFSSYRYFKALVKAWAFQGLYVMLSNVLANDVFAPVEGRAKDI